MNTVKNATRFVELVKGFGGTRVPLTGVCSDPIRYGSFRSIPANEAPKVVREQLGREKAATLKLTQCDLQLHRPIDNPWTPLYTPIHKS